MQEDVQKALNRAYFFLKFRPRTKKEVVDYLQKKSDKWYHWVPEVIDQAIESLQLEGLVDDEKFVESFVVSRSTLKPKSEFVLRRELSRLGVEKNILDNYFNHNPISESDLALKALWSRWPRLQHFSKKTRFEKAAQFLLRRGFSFSTAKKAIVDMEDNE